MASSRNINAPGVELREIDRSAQSLQDNSLPNAPVVLVTGVSDHGINYYPQWINSKKTFVDKFGLPTTEEEKYFFNACMNVIKRGGMCVASRLPYQNIESIDGGSFSYCDYFVDSFIHKIGNASKISNVINIIGDIHSRLIEVLIHQNLIIEFSQKYELTKVSGLIDAITDLNERYVLPHDNAIIVNDLKIQIINLIDFVNNNNKEFIEIAQIDSTLTSYVQIYDSEYGEHGVPNRGTMSMKEYDELATGMKSGILNHIRVVDISRKRYQKANFSCVSSIIDGAIQQTNDAIGIFPVITTSINAMYFQKMFINISADVVNISKYNPVNDLSTVLPPAEVSVDLLQLSDQQLIKCADLSSGDSESISKIASQRFPALKFVDTEKIDTVHLKDIGVVVFQAFTDSSNSGKINFNVIESFYGSLSKNSTSKDDGSSTFIDNIVNNNSKYIRVFSNVSDSILNNTSMLYINNQKSRMLGLFNYDCQKTIDVKTTILDSLNTIFDICKDPNQIPLDIVVDAGVSNIAQFYQSLKESQKKKDEFVWKLSSNRNDIKTQTRIWRQVIDKFDNFCHFVRKDCMFIADGLRPFCLVGNQKIVRRSDPGSTVEKNIIPLLNNLVGINSSYSAGYCNWLYSKDEYSGDLFWCPPSIHAASIYIYCDTYFHTWDAPAGMTRGIVKDAIDSSFNPTIDEAGKIYDQSWNYAINYPIDGIIIEGQKTFQTNKTALDRVNVRRLLLKLEKQVIRVAKYFLYEGNTSYNRQKFIDTIKPFFEAAVNGSGIVEYAIKCDDELNTTQVIDNNELRCKIAIKPIKTIEFIVLDFIATNQTVSVSEEVLK